MMTKKIILLLTLLLCFAGTYSCKFTSKSKIEKSAKKFAEALYCFKFTDAQQYMTSESRPILSFLSSNINQTDLDSLKKAGNPTISILDIHLNKEETQATVKLKIRHFVKLNLLNNHPTIENEKEETFLLVKIDDHWLVDFRR